MKSSGILKLSLWILIPLLTFGGGYLLGKKRFSAQDESKQIYAIADGKEITAEMVGPQIQSQVKEFKRSIYDTKRRAVEDLVRSGLKTEPIDPEKIQHTEEEWQRFLTERNVPYAKLDKKTQEVVKRDFKNYLLAIRQRDQMKDLKIQWLIPLDFMERVSGIKKGSLPEIGEKNGGADVFLFGNYHCPNCKTIPAKVESLKDRARVYWRPFTREPENSIGYYSVMGAFCADDLGKFAEYHRAVFETPPVQWADLNNIAAIAGMDENKFESCAKSDRFKKEIAENNELAAKWAQPHEAVAVVNGFPLLIQENPSQFDLALSQRP